jgi:hypothetical protein
MNPPDVSDSPDRPGFMAGRALLCLEENVLNFSFFTLPLNTLPDITNFIGHSPRHNQLYWSLSLIQPTLLVTISDATNFIGHSP